MSCEIQQIDPQAPAPEAFTRAATILRAGGLVVFPTETVYGLGANALDETAVARIFAAKGRPARNPLIVHVADLTDARKLAADWPDVAQRLAERFWPGPLTLVVPKQACVPDLVTAGGPTVALRIPAHPVALALLRACGLPLAGPSANRSTSLSPTRAEHVLRGLADRIDLLLDAGPTTGGLESTVVDVTTQPPRLLRPGLVTTTELEAVVGPLGQPGSDGGPLRSPGLLDRHYAPRTPLEVMQDSHERVQELSGQGRRVGWMTHRHEPNPPASVLRIAMPADAVKYAERLYAVLHDLDDVGLDRIIVEAPPANAAWLAVSDRLRRASAEEG